MATVEALLEQQRLLKEMDERYKLHVATLEAKTNLINDQIIDYHTNRRGLAPDIKLRPKQESKTTAKTSTKPSKPSN